MANHEYRVNESAWRKVNRLDDLIYVMHSLGLKDTLEVRLKCTHDNTWVDQGIKICKDCGKQLEVTSFRD